MRKILYRIGKYLCARFGDELPQPTDVIDADRIADIVLHKLTAHLFPENKRQIREGSPVPLPVPPQPEPIERNLPRVVAKIIADVPGASLASIADRSMKALGRLHPEIGGVDLANMVYGEMQKNGIA